MQLTVPTTRPSRDTRAVMRRTNRLAAAAALGLATALSLAGCGSGNAGTAAPNAMSSTSGNLPAGGQSGSTASGTSQTPTGGGSSSSLPSTAQVTGGSATLALSAQAHSALSLAGITIAGPGGQSASQASSGSSSSTTPGVRMNVDGGQLSGITSDQLPTGGELSSSEGIAIAAAGQQIPIDNVTIDFGSDTVSGDVAGQHATLFALDPTNADISRSGNTLTMSGLGITVNADLAQKLTQQLHLPKMAGMILPSIDLGTLTVQADLG